jgi:FHS family glucose/mannose:H+ symporter-like MFS transporter
MSPTKKVSDASPLPASDFGSPSSVLLVPPLATGGMASLTVLYSAFALTGFATALLGATLPRMLAHWSLTDGTGGLLFFLLFLGSSTGALLSRGRHTHSVARGACVLFPACLGLAFSAGWTVKPLCLLYGLGLGITITSINQLRSSRRPDARAREMNRLNLIWALGAALCPWVANEILRVSNVRFLFLALGASFALFALWAILFEVRLLPSPRVELRQSTATKLRLPFIIAITTLLATGIESSTGAWIATYADRLRSGFAAPVAAATIFWLGLLISRALHSMRMSQRFSESALLRSGVSIACLGCVLLIAAQGQALLFVAAFLIGFGVGPVYPLLLASALPRFHGTLIFVVAGLGGTMFPWLTGTVSTRAHSLRLGLMVPAAASILLMALGLRVAQMIGLFDKHPQQASAGLSDSAR